MASLICIKFVHFLSPFHPIDYELKSNNEIMGPVN